MILRIAVVVFWALLTSAVIWWAYQEGRIQPHDKPAYQAPAELKEERKVPGLPNGLASPEDRAARFTWEMKRLVNPITGKLPQKIRERELNFVNRKFKTSKANSTVWDKRGPFNVGGRTRAVVLDADNENIIVAGGVTGGMWRSTDGGQSFTKTTTPYQLHSVTSIVQDTRPGKRNVWYHGTGEYYAIISASDTRGSGNGIFKSTNGGQSWQLLPSTVSNTPTTIHDADNFDFVWQLAVDPSDLTNDVVYAAVINTIYRSKDGGSTWSAVLGGGDTLGVTSYTEVAVTPTGVVYAVLGDGRSDYGVYRSVDQGDSWTNISPPGFSAASKRSVIGLNPMNEEKLYLLTLINSTNHTLYHYTYVSGDGSGNGGYWENRSASLPDEPCEVFYDFDFGTYNSQFGYDMCVAVSPGDTNVVLIGGTNAYRSYNGWRVPGDYDWIGGYQCDTVTPSNYVYPNHHPDQHDFVFLPSDANKLITANDGGLYRTDNILQDSVRWTSLNNGYINSQFYTVAIEGGTTTSNNVVGGMQDNGTYYTNSGDGSIPWKSVFYGDGAYCAITEGRTNYYLSWQLGKLFKFDIAEDGTVNGLTRIDPEDGGGYDFINPFILDPADNNRLYMAGGRYVWRNSKLNDIILDGDEYNADTLGWERIEASRIPGSIFNAGSVSAMDISKSDNSKLFFGTSTGAVSRLDNLNGGVITRSDIGSTDFPAGYVASIDVNENNPNEILVAFSNYEIKSLFHTTDGGQSWTQVGGNLEENPDGSGDGPAVLWAEMLDMVDSTVYYAGTSAGLFSTTELNGASTVWTQEGPNVIGNVVVNMIKTRSHDGLVAVATHGTGVYSTRLKPLNTGIEASEFAAGSSTNMVCAPNPFQSSTKISYRVDKDATVKLKIYGLNGQLVRDLYSGEQPRGTHDHFWNGTDEQGRSVAAGTYLLTCQIADNLFTEKLLYTP